MANIKTVGLRQIPRTLRDWQDEVPPVQFPDDIEAADAVRSRDESDAEFGAAVRQRTASVMIEKLRPSEFAAFKMLRPYLSREIGQLAVGGHKLCMIVRLNEKSWISPFSAAFSACLLDLAADLDADLPTVNVRTIGIDRSFGNRGLEVARQICAVC